jgi:hypothetical protein
MKRCFAGVTAMKEKTRARLLMTTLAYTVCIYALPANDALGQGAYYEGKTIKAIVG